MLLITLLQLGHLLLDLLRLDVVLLVGEGLLDFTLIEGLRRVLSDGRNLLVKLLLVGYKLLLVA